MSFQHNTSHKNLRDTFKSPRDSNKNSYNNSRRSNRPTNHSKRHDRSNGKTRPERNGSSKNYKKKEDYIEYRFSDNGGDIKAKNKPYLDVEISVEKVRKVFEQFREKFGENEIIKEYSTYKHNDMELTVFPDGSSFCRQVTMHEVKDTRVPSGIFVTYKEKYKISNDYFPCKYIYNSALDVIDVIFNVTDKIKIVLSTTYENNRTVEKLKKIEDLGRPSKIKRSKNAWCELYVTVGCSCDVEDVHNTINFVKDVIDEN